MNRTDRYRDANFEAHIEQIEFALDRELFQLSPVVEAVRLLRRRARKRESMTHPTT